MPERTVAASDTPFTQGGFASGMLRLFEEFVQSTAGGESLTIRLTLADGSHLDCKDLHLIRVRDVPGCVMVHGDPRQAKEAVIVREDHIISAYLIVREEPELDEQNYPFGFAAGSSVPH